MLDAVGQTSGSCIEELVGNELLAQRSTIDTEDLGCLALIAAGVLHDRLEQRLLDFAHDELIEVRRPVAVQTCQISAQGVVGQGAKWLILYTHHRLAGCRLFLLLFL